MLVLIFLHFPRGAAVPHWCCHSVPSCAVIASALVSLPPFAYFFSEVRAAPFSCMAYSVVLHLFLVSGHLGGSVQSTIRVLSYSGPASASYSLSSVGPLRPCCGPSRVRVLTRTTLSPPSRLCVYLFRHYNPEFFRWKLPFSTLTLILSAHLFAILVRRSTLFIFFIRDLYLPTLLASRVHIVLDSSLLALFSLMRDDYHLRVASPLPHDCLGFLFSLLCPQWLWRTWGSFSSNLFL